MKEMVAREEGIFGEKDGPLNKYHTSNMIMVLRFLKLENTFVFRCRESLMKE
jgi:hypothetical protein